MEIRLNKDEVMKKINLILVMLGCLVFCANVFAVTVPYTFSAGSTAKASEVNANFGSLKTAVSALEGSTMSKSTFNVINASGTTILKLSKTRDGEGFLETKWRSISPIIYLRQFSPWRWLFSYLYG